jgi:2-polyprenyl-3-methyl-5-hydroxy-6-metoxy-1,4-benzoquinol methylase
MKELARDEVRFGFGENWRSLITNVDDDRIREAEKSLQMLLGLQDLDGKTFRDVGSGSGLFSLVARKLGARVYSFDFDRNSVEASLSLGHCYFAGDANWTAERGSVLDSEFLHRLGTFDVVHSWAFCIAAARTPRRRRGAVLR